MDSNEIERIKNLIQKAETQKAKAEGVIEKIKSEWKEKYGTDDISVIRNKLEELESELESSNERIESIYNKLLESNDWDKLEQELN